jgi:hypothetical protein
LKDKEMAEKEKAIEAEIKDAKWSGRLEELRLVAAGNGGTAHVSQGDPERPALGTWCNTQVSLALSLSLSLLSLSHSLSLSSPVRQF